MTGVSSYGFTVEELLAAHVRCAYPSKVCVNPRAVKLCGSLNKLCEFHRKKASLNQKRLQQRRRRVIRAQMAMCTPFGTAFDAPAMKVDFIQLLNNDSQQVVTTASKGDVNDDFSVFESSFLKSCMFVNSGNAAVINQVVQQAAPAGFYESYTAVNDQAHAKYEAFNFELRL